MTTEQLAAVMEHGLRRVGEDYLELARQLADLHGREPAGRQEEAAADAVEVVVADVPAPSPAVLGAGWDWRLVEERSGVTFKWFEHPAPERYITFRVYEGSGPEGKVRLGLGQCGRDDEAGRHWGYYIVHIVRPRSIEPVAEFREVDGAGPEGPLVAIIRGKGATKRQMFKPGEPLPAGYENLPLTVHRDHVAGGYRRAAVIARADQPEVMLEHGLIQARHRYGYNPS